MFQYENISINQAQQILESGSCTVFDMRDDRSYEMGRLPGAQRINDQIIRRMRRTEQRHSPVLIYCYHGNSSKDLAQMLCDFGFSKVYSLDGGYSAWEAAKKQATPIAENNNSLTLNVYIWLVEQGVDPNNINQRLNNGMTALMQACRLGLADVAKTLLQMGADIKLTNNDGNNALWLACFSGDIATISVLLENGVDIDNQNITGATALIYAASAGKTDVVKCLLDAGANPYKITQDDFTALDLAASPQTYKLLRSLRINTADIGVA
ncbi:ankyrin repeat domain-containing protein [Kaarinaea lacus]